MAILVKVNILQEDNLELFVGNKDGKIEGKAARDHLIINGVEDEETDNGVESDGYFDGRMTLMAASGEGQLPEGRQPPEGQPGGGQR